MENRGMKLLAYSLIFIFISTSLHAQRCETNDYQKKFPVTSSVFNRTTDQDKNARDTITNEVITIPVVIHVLYNTPEQNITDAQILSQIESLNKDYRKLNTDGKNTPWVFAPLAADARIVFCLAKIDAAGKPASGIIRKYTSVQNWRTDDGMKYTAQGGDNAWDSKKYLNIWVCNLLNKSLGYSSVPGSQSDRDGVVIQYNVFGTTGNVVAPFNKGRTATHEIGHWLGLKHLWGDASCGDDGVGDTPPQQSFNNGNPSFPHRTGCSKDEFGDMFMNFLDFTDDATMTMFSKGQVLKMRSLFALGGARNSFLYSKVCDSNVVQRAAMPIIPAQSNVTVALFPNPAARSINLEVSATSGIVGKTVKICNAYGDVVISYPVSTVRSTIDLGRLSPGVYYLKIGDGKTHKPIIFIKK